MALFPQILIRRQSDIAAFESAMPLDQRLPERSVLDVFVGAAECHPERTALTMLMTGALDENPRRVNYAELLSLVRRSANLFATLGGPRPGVAYMLPSLVETHATLWGAETSGYAVPINFLLQPDAIAALLQASGARILVALGPHPALDIWAKALAVRERLPDLVLVRVAPSGTAALDGVIDFVDAIARQPEDRLLFGEPGRDDEVCAYFHTGGTTGTPKLVTHTHRGQLVAALGGCVMSDTRPDDTLTATLPLFHVGGTIYGSLSKFMAGSHLLVMSPGGLRNPVMVQNFWRLVAQYRVTLVGSVPTALGAVLETPVGGEDVRSVRFGATGAASCPPAVSERFRQVTGHPLHEVYGMTEASGLIAIRAAGDQGGEGSVGWALPYTEVVVRRLEADGTLGPTCPTGEIGVVTVRGPHVSPGYRNPEQDAGVFKNGVLNTGDLGYTDAEGRLYIAGRAKDLIIRSGHNIDPLMIENAMTTHPAVLLAAAVGIPDAYAGELPVCYVSLRPGARAFEAELHEHAQRTITERPAWPRRIHIVDTIPLTSVGKIYKPQLRADAAERLVSQIVQDELGVVGARVKAQEGGKRGLLVTVQLPPAAQLAKQRVQEVLASFLFEAEVTLG